MPNWDVFHADRLEVERDLTAAQVRALWASGQVREDDLVRPAGSSEAWKRLGDVPALVKPGPDEAPPAKISKKDIPTAVLLDDLGGVRSPGAGADRGFSALIDDDRRTIRELSDAALRREEGDSELALPVAEMEQPEYDPLAEDEAAAGFTFSARGGQEREEDLDLAAMVDVAFQLILFFLVTASTVFFKSLEIPPPDPEKQRQSQQAVAQRIEDLQNDNILLEIDARGQYLIDHEPVAPDNLAARMRSIREKDGRTAMLLMADHPTPHKYVVHALDAANEIGLLIKLGRTSEE